MNSDLLAGTSYRVIRELGRGGMGEVYEAEHVVLGRRVAIKVMSAGMDLHPETLDRFRLEAQALALLQHPGIVAVHDVSTTPEGRAFVVMEMLEGRTLADLLHAHGHVEIRELVRIGSLLLDALQCAHDAGLVHRDVKPGNVFLCSDGRVKLLDFGIAKVVRADSRVRPLEQPTAEGFPIGTPTYFPPEQALGQPVDGRADLYAVGGLLWTLSVGRRIFSEAKELHELFNAHFQERPRAPSREAKQPIPIAFDDVVLRALEKRPADRFQSAHDMRAALEAVFPPPPPPSEPPASIVIHAPPLSPLAMVFLVFVGAAVAGAGIALYEGFLRPRPAPAVGSP